MKKLFLDTNVLLRFLLGDNKEQFIQTEQLFKKAQNKTIHIIIPQQVVFEMNYILSKYYSLSKDEVISYLEPLITTDFLNIESRDIFLKSLTIYKYVSDSISFVDCFLLAKAQVEEGELFTFDKKLQVLQKTR